MFQVVTNNKKKKKICCISVMHSDQKLITHKKWNRKSLITFRKKIRSLKLSRKQWMAARFCCCAAAPKQELCMQISTIKK